MTLQTDFPPPRKRILDGSRLLCRVVKTLRWAQLAAESDDRETAARVLSAVDCDAGAVAQSLFDIERLKALFDGLGGPGDYVTIGERCYSNAHTAAAGTWERLAEAVSVCCGMGTTTALLPGELITAKNWPGVRAAILSVGPIPDEMLTARMERERNFVVLRLAEGKQSCPKFLGDGRYLCGDGVICLTGNEAFVLESLVKLGAATKDDLVTGSGVADAPRVLKSILKKYKQLAPFITLPGGRNAGGYRTKIQPADGEA